MDLAIESDTAGQRFAGVMQEGRPAHRGAGWGLAYDPDCMVPEVFLTAEPWREVCLRLSRKRLDLRERNVQESGPAQRIESVIDVLAKQQQGQFRQNSLTADSCQTWSLVRPSPVRSASRV